MSSYAEQGWAADMLARRRGYPPGSFFSSTEQTYLNSVYAGLTNKHASVELPCPHCSKGIKVQSHTDNRGDITIKVEKIHEDRAE